MFSSMRILVVEDDKKIASFVVNGLKQSGFAGSRRRHDQAAGAFSERRHQIDNAGFDQVGRSFEAKLFDRIDGGEVLEANGFGARLEPVYPLRCSALAAFFWRCSYFLR